MSEIKHVDKKGIVRHLFSFPGDPMTLSQGGGYPLSESVIADIIDNGIDSCSFSDLSHALRLILESVDMNRYKKQVRNIYWGISTEAAEDLEKLIKSWFKGGAGAGSQVYIGDDCAEHLYAYYRPEFPNSVMGFPDGAGQFELWQVNKEKKTASIPDADGGMFLIEFTQDEFDEVMEYDDCFSDYTQGLDDEESYAYFFSADEVRFMKEDLKNFILAVNDIVRKYGEKYVVKLN